MQVSFNYIIEDGVVFLVITETGYPKRLGFAFLADVHKHFVDELSRDFGDR